jgi:hypothetical protein
MKIMEYNGKVCFSEESHEQGMESFLASRAGVITLACLTIAVVIGISVLVVTASSDRIIRGASLSADEIADAGMSHAAGILATLNESDADDVLLAGDGIPGTGDELAAVSADLGPIPARGVRFGGGLYRVSVTDDAGDDGNDYSDNNGVLLVTVHAVSRVRESVSHEAEVRIGGAYPAILTNGPLKLSGTLDFFGDLGYPHTNGLLLIGDGICTESPVEDVSEVWQTNGSPDCTLLKSLGTKRALAPVPAVDVSKEFRPMATVILGADDGREGLVMDTDGVLIHRAGSARSRGSWSRPGSRWEWDPGTGTWRHYGPEIPEGSYHSDGNMEIVGPLGTAASPARITLSAEGFIAITGIANMRPYREPYIAMAGTDLSLSGTAMNHEGYSFHGVLRANDQTGITGTLRLAGSLISSNHGDDGSPGCSCNPVPLVDGIQELVIDGMILNEGGFRQPRIRNHQKKKKPAR